MTAISSASTAVQSRAGYGANFTQSLKGNSDILRKLYFASGVQEKVENFFRWEEIINRYLADYKKEKNSHYYQATILGMLEEAVKEQLDIEQLWLKMIQAYPNVARKAGASEIPDERYQSLSKSLKKLLDFSLQFKL